LRQPLAPRSDIAVSNAWSGPSISLPRGITRFIESLWLRLVRRQPTGES
jgi:hypothetical protein